MVGYPLNAKGEPQVHCTYIERWVEHMWSIGVAVKVPVTLVNEYNSSMQAKVHIAESIQQQLTSTRREEQKRLQFEGYK